VCGPEPKAFYLKMGAKVMGEEESKVVPGRRILKFEVSIPLLSDRKELR
jgi:hypothetical protein